MDKASAAAGALLFLTSEIVEQGLLADEDFPALALLTATLTVTRSGSMTILTVTMIDFAYSAVSNSP